MIFFLINRFRRKKLRARENRQTAEDQRSIVGSIGYIAGNMGYMEGNLSSMDYTYGGAATHYPLWKPPSGYFPRGEAPPPYDEAVAISQAEALSAQCAAAAAAAQVAATQRATMGMSSVELQAADMNRRAQVNQQMQQIQHHQQSQPAHTQLNHQTAHVVPTMQTHVLAAQTQPNSQSHQITQSTTNLINININSGGNITTIATGENHQPPYSLQDESNAGAALMQQQQQHQQQHQQQQNQQAAQQMQLQQQQQMIAAAAATTSCGGNTSNSGRVHIAQSNSICVQTMTPIISQQHQQQQHQHHQQQQQQQQQMPAPQQPSTTQSVLQPAQIMTSTVASNSTNSSMSRQHTATPQTMVATNTNDCGYKNCHLNTANVATSTLSRRLHRGTEPMQQYVVDVEVNVGNASARGYHSLPPCSNSAAASEMEVIASPTQFGNTSPSITTAISTPAIDVGDPAHGTNDLSSPSPAANAEGNNLLQITNNGHSTLPLQHTQSNKSSSNGGAGGTMKTSSSSSSSTSSSSKRYHRTMPRYYAVADPLTPNLNVSSGGKTKSESKSSANSNIGSSSTTSSNASSSASSSKKPTCQCPVQHVPMSYMGSTQLSNAQNVTNNAFFTVLSSKLNSTSSASNSPSASSHHSSSRLQQQNTHNTTNSLNYPQHRSKSSQSSSTDNILNSANSTMKRSSNTNHCSYEGKIATISSGELINPSAAAQQVSSSQHQQQQQQQQHHHHSHAHSHGGGHAHGGGGHHSSSLLLPPQHHDDSSPIVLGRVTKRSSSSSGDRLRSASSGSTRSSIVEGATITSPAAAAYLNSKVDAYLSFTHGHGSATSHHHLKALNSDIMNPALPPKLHKSLTNLKSSSSAASSVMVIAGQQTNNASTHRNSHKINNGDFHNSTNTNTNTNTNTTTTATSNTLNCNNTISSNNSFSNAASASASASASSSYSLGSSCTTSVQTIYTLSKPSSSSAAAAAAAASLIGLTTSTSTTSPLLSASSSSHHHRSKDHHDHIMKIQQPPSLTLPLSTTSTTTSFTSSTSKINTSTFYPLQNNVTYTLPKNVGGGGKMSLNSTINSVVSKVPSVISLPPTGAEQNNNYHGCSGGYNMGMSSSDNSYNSHQYLNEMSATGNSSAPQTSKSTTLPKILRSKRDLHINSAAYQPNASASSSYAVSQCSMPAYPKQCGAPSPSTNLTHPHQPTNINNMQTQTITSTLAANYCPEDSHLNIHSNGSYSKAASNSASKQLPVCTTSKNCLNPKEHFLPNDTSLDDDYLSECENCKIAQSSKYYLNAEALTCVGGPQETMTLQRKSLEECKEEPETGYYRISHTLPTNSKKNAPVKNNNRDQWFSTIPAASSSSEEDVNE